MGDLKDLIKNQFNKDVNIVEYSGELLSNNQQVFKFNNIDYILEFLEQAPNVNGFIYGFYQANLDLTLLKDILLNLYPNSNVFEHDKFILLCSKFELDISVDTTYILESESYKKTAVIELGYINSSSDLNNKIEIIKKLINYNVNFVCYNDLVIFDYIISKSNSMISDKSKFEILDKNLLDTGISFIENDLNLSKTSNSLFLHRNTLIYRLDKIKEILNLDLKHFKDAFIFYINAKYL